MIIFAVTLVVLPLLIRCSHNEFYMLICPQFDEVKWTMFQRLFLPWWLKLDDHVCFSLDQTILIDVYYLDLLVFSKAGNCVIINLNELLWFKHLEEIINHNYIIQLIQRVDVVEYLDMFVINENIEYSTSDDILKICLNEIFS